MQPDTSRIRLQPVSCSPPVEAVIAAVASRRDPAVLDSAQPDAEQGRFTIVACDPVAVVTCGPGGGDPFEELRGHLRRSGFAEALAEPGPPDIPFPAGWIGYFAYEAGRYVETLPATTQTDVGLPVARFALYDSAAILDRRFNRWTVAAVDLAGVSTLASTEKRLATWAALLQNARPPTLSPMSPPVDPGHNLSRDQYLRMVARAREYIAAGDIFQVNLSRRETVTATEPSWMTYLRLRRANPGAYAAFLSWQEGRRNAPAGSEAAILCSSPELFLRLRDGHVLTRPIKGTRPRSADPAADERLRRELAASEKDRAELAMIVDLERNDLGRVCEYGSIRVLGDPDAPAFPYTLESHPTVHHLVASVTGRLAPGRDAIDLLRACFPGGSITGAPKVRAMEIIDELESTERSAYTGAIGWFGPGGTMTMNIAIRTIIRAGGRLHLYAGGGIVADSIPEDEYAETCAKSLGMRRALGLVPPGLSDGHDRSEPVEPALRSQS